MWYREILRKQYQKQLKKYTRNHKNLYGEIKKRRRMKINYKHRIHICLYGYMHLHEYTSCMFDVAILQRGSRQGSQQFATVRERLAKNKFNLNLILWLA